MGDRKGLEVHDPGSDVRAVCTFSAFPPRGERAGPSYRGQRRRTMERRYVDALDRKGQFEAMKTLLQAYYPPVPNMSIGQQTMGRKIWKFCFYLLHMQKQITKYPKQGTDDGSRSPFFLFLFLLSPHFFLMALALPKNYVLSSKGVTSVTGVVRASNRRGACEVLSFCGAPLFGLLPGSLVHSAPPEGGSC